MKSLLRSMFDIDFSLICVCSLELTEKDYDGQSAIYWEVKYPFPLSNRDVSYRNISQIPISLLKVFLEGLFGLSLPSVRLASYSTTVSPFQGCQTFFGLWATWPGRKDWPHFWEHGLFRWLASMLDSWPWVALRFELDWTLRDDLSYIYFTISHHCVAE